MKTAYLKNTKLAGGLGLLLALTLILSMSLPAFAADPPAPPHGFIGNVWVCTTPAGENVEVTAKVQGLATPVWTVMTDSDSYFISLGVPGDDPGTPAKDGAVEGDTVELYVMGQMLYSILWVSNQVNDGTLPFVPLDLVVQPELTITIVGNGTTTPAAGAHMYTCGDPVTLTATPGTGQQFDGWSGPDAGQIATGVITMNGNYDITATFSPTGTTYTLDITVVGSGTTTPPAGINGPYAPGDPVTLTATPDTGYQFDGWSGPDAGEIDAGVITMNGNYDITATFSLIGTTYTLDITVVGSGTTTPPAGTNGPYAAGTPVTLTATPDTGYQFDGWSGTDAGEIDAGVITMNGNYDITATFSLKQVDLTTASTAGGSVTAPGEPGPYTYNCGQQVTIVATASGCYNFTGWTGDIGDIADTGAASTTITMNADYSITANFELASELVDVEIPFNLGWNTFSTPISLHECVNTWDEFIAANNLAIEMIYGYDSASEAWVPVDGGDGIEPLYGFYVKTTQAGVAHIIPNNNETSPPTRELSSGVHLIGPAPASLEDIDVVSALITIYEVEAMPSFSPTGYTLVVSPYLNSPNDWSYVRDATPIPDMSIGRAYWAVMDNADLYVGETTTPLAP